LGQAWLTCDLSPGRIAYENEMPWQVFKEGSMPEEKKTESTLSQQLDDFKKQNPKIAEAMKLFGMTLTKYQESLHALYSPQIYQSNSTAKLKKP
jgi:precorrin-4 methylase